MAKKITWKYLLSRRWTILLCELFFKGYTEPLTRYVGAPNKNLLMIKEGEEYSLYNALESLKTISVALVSKLKENKDFGKKIYKDCISASENLVNTSKQASSGELVSLDIENLIKRFNSYIKAILDYSPFLALPNNYEIYVIGEIKDFLIEKVGNEEAEEYLQKLMAPKEYPFQILEQIDLAKIALRVKGGEIHLEEEMNKHREKYQWLSCYNFDEKAFSLHDFKERLDSLLGLGSEELKQKSEDVIKKIDRDEMEFQRIAEKIGLKGELLERVDLLREFVFLRTYRIEMNCQPNFYLQPLLKEFARRSGISIQEIAMMLTDEIKRMAKEGGVPEGIDFIDRKKAAVIWLDDSKFNYVFGNKAREMISERFSDLKFVKGAKKVKGTVSSKGEVVQGRVRIITKENIGEFQEGEILITIMTSPEFVPAMQKAKAIITDEGGVLCHAAIVSRELNKPCIIGTRVSTKIFRNGDIVEVDTEKGIVKTLKKAK